MKRIPISFLWLLLLPFFSLFFCPSASLAAARAKVDVKAADPYAAALLLDAASGEVLFAENPDAVIYPASIVKLMNLLVVLERVERGQTSLAEMVPVTTEAAKTGGSQVYLDPKEQFTVEELLYALIVQSANDAAVALAVHITGSKEGFVALMNEKAEELGMSSTRFHSVHGLPPAEGQLPDETTARDLAKLSLALINRPDALQYTSVRERGFRDDKFIMRTHNHLLRQVDGCDGLKTGYFQAAGFSIAATAKRGGVRVVAIVAGSQDRKVRDAKAAELLAKGFALLPAKAEDPAAGQKLTVADTAVKPKPSEIKPGEPPPVADQVVPPVLTAEGSSAGWGMFFMGVLVGFALCAVVLFFLARKGSRGGRGGRGSTLGVRS